VFAAILELNSPAVFNLLTLINLKIITFAAAFINNCINCLFFNNLQTGKYLENEQIQFL